MRPEPKEVVQTWLKIYGDAKDVVLGVEAARTTRASKSVDRPIFVCRMTIEVWGTVIRSLS